MLQSFAMQNNTTAPEAEPNAALFNVNEAFEQTRKRLKPNSPKRLLISIEEIPTNKIALEAEKKRNEEKYKKTYNSEKK